MIGYFGQKLQKLRNDRELTQKQLSKILGIKRALLSNYERGATLPSVRNLVKIADYFNVSTDFLLGRSMAQTSDIVDLTDEQLICLDNLRDIFIRCNCKQQKDAN